MADLRTRLSHPPVRSRPRRDTCHPRLGWRYPGGAAAVCTVLALTGAAVATALSGPGSWLPTLGLAAVLTAVTGLPLWYAVYAGLGLMLVGGGFYLRGRLGDQH